tara:strand:- start:1314 stop:1544 length:231 start_codon:yes stop_codon:yes gene_type:complete
MNTPEELNNKLVVILNLITTLQTEMNDLVIKDNELKKRKLDYSRTDNARMRQKLANKKYYEKKLKTGNPVGRPKKK